MPVVFLIAPVLLLVAGVLHMVPELTRPDWFFTVTVPSDFRFSSIGRGILVRYRGIVWISTLIAIVAALLTGLPILAVLIPGAGYIGAFVSSYRRVLPHAAVANRSSCGEG